MDEQPAKKTISTIDVNKEILSKAELETIDKLLSAGQGHLFADWPTKGANDADKHRFLEQVAICDEAYPGGIAKYVANAKQLLQDSKEGKNPFDGWTPSVPKGLSVKYGSEEHAELEGIGMQEVGAAAFVLVAGGLGERLGYSGIKVELPAERATDTCYLQLYIKSILAFQARSPSSVVPLAIMTSDDTHKKTLDLLERGDYFGASRDQVTLIKQEKVPCLTDNEAHLALDPNDPYKLMTKPHGHGDVHALLHTSGLLKKWEQQGKRWITFFQDTNALVFRVVPGALGVSKKRGFVFNSLCVPRKAKEAIGAITELTHTDGRSMTINVEYNQLDPLLRATINKDGDVNNEEGVSPFPGNINQLIVSLKEYKAQLEKTGGMIEEFVNPKYKDDTKTTFKSPTRLECMMQDYPKSLPAGAAVGFTTFENWVGYSPVKNSPADGLGKHKGGNPSHTATSGELELYACAAKIMSMCGARVAEPVDATFNGMALPKGPAVVLHPSFGCTFGEIKGKVGAGCSVGVGSVLVLEGDVTVKKMELDGALIIRSAPGAKVVVDGLKVKNKGWKWVPTRDDDAGADEVDKLRGFVVSKEETAEHVFDNAGEFTLP